MAGRFKRNLYTLACRSFDPFDVAEGYSEAFDKCFEDYSPDLILQRVRVTDEERWIGLWQRVIDPFVWRIAWVNPKGFSERTGVPYLTGVAVIEDCYLDFQSWEPDLVVPRYSRCNYCEEHFCIDGEVPYMVPRLGAREVLDIFTNLCSEWDMLDTIECCLVRDAWLPCSLVDGVPESEEHGHVRRRVVNYARNFAVRSREYLSDPNWEDEIHAEEKRWIEEGFEPPRWSWWGFGDTV